LTGFSRNCHNRGLRRKRFASGLQSEAASKKKTAAVDETLKNLSQCKASLIAAGRQNKARIARSPSDAAAGSLTTYSR
jgi:hypothetical protein